MRNGGKRTAGLAVATVVGAVVGLFDHAAMAQRVCFPPAGGVPGGGGSGPPDWWSSGATPVGSTTSSFLDDPRWRGAVSHSWLDYERFRVLIQNTGSAEYLVMSWEVNADTNGTSDRLYFGVWDETAAVGNVFRLTRNQGTQTTIAGANFAASAFSGRIFKSSGALGAVTWSDVHAGSPPSPLPAWMTDDTRIDVSCATPPSTGCDRWAIRIRAKIDPAADTTLDPPTAIKISSATAPATRNFRFWYEVQDGGAIGSTLYGFPEGLAAARETGGLPPIAFPDPNVWQQAQLGSGSSCAGDILFDAGQVYVNTVGSNTLDLTSNAFHATPLNNVPTTTRPSIPNAALTARFRIANWGSAGYNSPEWRDTCTSGTGSAATVNSGTNFDLSCTWTGFDACPYKPTGDPCGAGAGTKDPHQCVLVDLGLPSGSLDKFFFSRQSVYRNMNFDVNSTLVRQATIDVKGLGPMPGGAANRDVYLYVHTRNLPDKVVPEPTTPTPTRDDKQAFQTLPPRARFPELQLPAQGPIGTKESARIQAAFQAGKLTAAQVEQIMPTYIVYVWHDSGRTIPTPTGPSKVLVAQPSYGLFLAHDGELDGWKHQLVASGAVQLAPNFYRVSPGNDSTFTATTTIEPVVICKGLFCTFPWWGWLLLLLLLLLVALVLRKKPAAP